MVVLRLLRCVIVVRYLVIIVPVVISYMLSTVLPMFISKDILLFSSQACSIKGDAPPLFDYGRDESINQQQSSASADEPNAVSNMYIT